MNEILKKNLKKYYVTAIAIAIIYPIWNIVMILFTQILDQKNNITMFIFAVLTIISSVVILIMWIYLIILSLRINRITQKSTLLVVFSVINMWIGPLIVCLYERKRVKSGYYDYYGANNINLNSQDYETSLKHAFMNNIISEVEYNEKLNDFKQDNTKDNK